MKFNPEIEIPLDKDGNQRLYAEYGTKPIYVPNFIFSDTLEYVDYIPGRSSAYLTFIALGSGLTYYMFLSNFHTVVKDMNGGRVTGRFTFTKKGTQVGLYRICE
jgi:hypothetical protein